MIQLRLHRKRGCLPGQLNRSQGKQAASLCNSHEQEIPEHSIDRIGVNRQPGVMG